MAEMETVFAEEADRDRSTAIKYADKMCSLYVRKYDPMCFQCGSTSNVQCGHLFPRGLNLRLRFDIRNLWPQCERCNMKHEANPLPMERAVAIRKGEAFVETLRAEMHTVERISTDEIRAIGRRYKEMADGL